jgi:streptomycin 6-kinase
MSDFTTNIIAQYGARGEAWLAALPTITAGMAKKYGLTELVPVSNMSFNYVASGYQAAKPIILKLGLDNKALAKEAHCLKAYAAHDAAEVFASDEGMIIMERAVPGTTLKEYFPAREDEAITILCSVIKTLHQADIPKTHDFFHVSDVLKSLDKDLEIPHKLLTKARHLRDKLLATTDKTVLLHGDLHHDNLLYKGDGQAWRREKNDDGWMVIDPKGFIGDPAFELAAYLCNPIPELLQESAAKQMILQRINSASAALDIPEQRIHDWLYVKSVLGWAWNLEDNHDPGYWPLFLEKISN